MSGIGDYIYGPSGLLIEQINISQNSVGRFCIFADRFMPAAVCLQTHSLAELTRAVIGSLEAKAH